MFSNQNKIIIKTGCIDIKCGNFTYLMIYHSVSTKQNI